MGGQRLKAWHVKLGRRIARTPWVRKAIVDRADLSAFRGPPTLRIIAGVFAIIFSFIMCWPLIGALGTVSIYLRTPWLFVMGSPVLYVLSHVCFSVGMILSGEKYTRVVFRWLTRVIFERFHSPDDVSPEAASA